MNDNLVKFLEPTKTIKEALPRIIEAFVSFYGESKREEIETKLNNVTIIGYQQPSDMENTINRIIENIDDELMTSYFNEINVERTKENESLFLSSTLKDTEYCSLRVYDRYLKMLSKTKDELKQEQEEKLIKRLQRIIPEISLDNINEYKENENFNDLLHRMFNGNFNNYEELLDELIESNNDFITNRARENAKNFYEDMDEIEFEEKFKSASLTELETYVKIYDKYNKIWEERTKELIPYIEYTKTCRQIKENLETKYYEKLIEEYSSLFTEEDIKEYNSYGIGSDKMKAYLGRSASSSSVPAYAFSEENEKILKSESDDWRKSSITYDRIEFFKLHGIDHGNNYEEYINDPECIKTIPSFEFIEKLKTRKEKIGEEIMIDYYHNIPEYKQNREILESLGLVLYDDYNATQYNQKSTFVSTNARRKDGELICSPIMCINIHGKDSYIDKNIIHELNHVLELDITSEDENGITFTCGWETMLQNDYKGKTEEKFEFGEHVKREHELISEIVNELIAEEITKILFANNGYIFCDEQDAKITGGTGYENTKFLIMPFLDKYLETVYQSRNGRLDILYEKVGKENFEEFNQLFHVFNKYLSGWGFFNMVNAKSNGKITELTEIYDELCEKRNMILAKMDQYTMEHKTL